MAGSPCYWSCCYPPVSQVQKGTSAPSRRNIISLDRARKHVFEGVDVPSSGRPACFLAENFFFHHLTTRKSDGCRQIMLAQDLKIIRQIHNQFEEGITVVIFVVVSSSIDVLLLPRRKEQKYGQRLLSVLTDVEHQTWMAGNALYC